MAKGTTKMNESVMEIWERESVQWRGGRESEAKGFVLCEERWNWKLNGGEELADMRRS